MRYGKITVYLFTLLFGVLALLLWAFEPPVETVPIEVVVSAAGEERTVTGWENEEGQYFLFLPSYADLSSAHFRIHARNVRIDGMEAQDGMSCEEFAPDKGYSFSFDSPDGPVETELILIRSENLPAVYVETGSGSMEYIHGKKGNQEAGRMSLYLPDGELAYIGNLDAVNGRGNTWIIPKKSYSLQLAGAADLLGMGQAEKWILLSNAFDASHLRNKLVYDFAGELGLPYSPESRWVDLYLNGEYAGLYLLCERNEFQDQRISLTGEGSYLVSMDNQWRLEENARPFLTTQSGYAFRIHSSQVGEATLQQLLQLVENAVSAEDGRDPVTGKHWSELIDVDSWARKYLVEEIFGNGDAGAISQYFYGSSPEDRMYAGPVWDYDISMGNPQGLRGGNPQSIFAGRKRVRSTVSLSWYYELYQQEAFRERVVEIYREECLPLLETFLTEQLEDSSARIEQAAFLNRIRWRNLAAYETKAPEETALIRDFMEQRIAFLNELWLEQEPFYWVLIDTNDGHGTLCFAVRPGEQIPYLPEYEPAPEILGWYAAGAEEPFDPEQPILENTELILRRIQPEEIADAEDVPEETEIKIPLKYAPFYLLVGVLGMLWLLDRKRGRRSVV